MSEINMDKEAEQLTPEQMVNETIEQLKKSFAAHGDKTQFILLVTDDADINKIHKFARCSGSFQDKASKIINPIGELLRSLFADEEPPANDNVVAGVDGAQGAKDAE